MPRTYAKTCQTCETEFEARAPATHALALGAGVLRRGARFGVRFLERVDERLEEASR